MYVSSLNNITPHKYNFKAKKIFDLKSANQKLLDCEKKNFISNIDREDNLSSATNEEIRAKINKYLSDNSLQDYKSKLFLTTPNEAPYKFAAIVKKQYIQNKNFIISNFKHPIFENIEESDIVETLDTLSYYVRENYNYFKENDIELKIADKNLKIKYAGKGCNGIVCKLSDDKENEVAFETYIDPEKISSFSIFGELALYQELQNEKINNIPNLILANPLVTRVVDKDVEINNIIENIDNIKNFDGYKGGWTIVEFIKPDTPIKQNGISFLTWLKNHKLYHLDLSADNLIGKYIVDLGGVGI